MNFVPFKLIGSIELAVQAKDIKSLVGLACDVRKNSIGLTEYDFDKYVFRFHENGNLSEVTAECAEIEINNKPISFKNLSDYISLNDSQSFEKVGFIISPKLGLVFDPEFEPWITFLTNSGLERWLNELQVT